MLLEVELPVVTNTVCKTVYTEGEIYDGVICAGGEAGKSACNVSKNLMEKFSQTPPPIKTVIIVSKNQKVEDHRLQLKFNSTI